MLGMGVALLSGCGRQAVDAKPAAATTDKLPELMVFKSVGCTCCEKWVEHMRHAGFSVQVQELDNMNETKTRVGIPPAMGSCHTGEVAGYFVEGHVPAEDVLRLLAQRPDAKGLTVPGMPLGSPGMEVPGQNQPYDVLLVARDGTTSVFAHHGPEQPVTG
jgi:hypothetical protein